MRKHAENAKAKEVTTEPENEVRQDDSLSESQKRVLEEMEGPQAGPQHPVDLASAQPEPAEPQAGPVNVADLQPGRDVDPMLGDKADVLQFLSQLTQAIEGAGIINGKYFEGLITGFNERLAALEAAVKQNSKQSRALAAKITGTLELIAAAQEG